jgi:DNA-binding transcriptional ArsR family regulator
MFAYIFNISNIIDMKVEQIQISDKETISTLDPEKMEKVAFILKTIAHPLRISIISLLVSNEKLCVNDICRLLSSEQSLTSHHLSNMKLSGILGSVREGKNIYYFLKLQEVVTVINCMNKCELI